MPAPLDPVELLRRLIRFDTSNPPGDERPLLEHVAGLLSARAVAPCLLGPDRGRPNLLARVEGRGEAPPLLLYGHVDVVAADAEDWRQFPFAGVLAGGEVWGRGALDMKSGVAMLVCAFLAAAAEPAPGDVLLALTSDEERGSNLGARHLVEREAGRFAGVRHGISEFGGPCLHLGGRRLYPVQVAEKRPCLVRATARARAGHAATPPAATAVGRLASFLDALERRGLPPRLTPIARTMLEAIAACAPTPQRLALLGLARRGLTRPLLAGLGAAARPLAPMLRDTAVATSLRAGPGGNVVPASAVAELDARILPGRSGAELLADLRRLAPAGVELELLAEEPPPARPPDLALMPFLSGIVAGLDPGAAAFPLLLPGATDARFFARLGIQTYGFLPLRTPAQITTDLIHAADERVPAAAVRFGAEALERAVRRYPVR